MHRRVVPITRWLVRSGAKPKLVSQPAWPKKLQSAEGSEKKLRRSRLEYLPIFISAIALAASIATFYFQFAYEKAAVSMRIVRFDMSSASMTASSSPDWSPSCQLDVIFTNSGNRSVAVLDARLAQSAVLEGRRGAMSKKTMSYPAAPGYAQILKGSEMELYKLEFPSCNFSSVKSTNESELYDLMEIRISILNHSGTSIEVGVEFADVSVNETGGLNFNLYTDGYFDVLSHRAEYIGANSINTASLTVRKLSDKWTTDYSSNQKYTRNVR